MHHYTFLILLLHLKLPHSQKSYLYIEKLPDLLPHSSVNNIWHLQELTEFVLNFISS